MIDRLRSLGRAGLAFLLAILLALPMAVGAVAQSQPAAQPAPSQPRSFLPPRAGEPQVAPSGPIARFTQWVTAWQARINRQLAEAVRAIRTGSPLYAILVLSGLSFAYGILHAAGPGHGKAVISSYVLANERTVKRGIALSFLAAFFQAISALILVGVLVIAFRATGLAIKATEAWLETVSWGLVAAVGAWLLYRQLKPLLAARSAPAAGHHHHGGHHHAGHDHGAGHHGHARQDQREHAHAGAHHHGHGHGHATGHSHGHSHGGHGHDHHHRHHHDHHHHADGSCCGHTHMPDPRQLEGAWSWRQALALALAVGIRPCTGAILVLIFAFSQGLLWAGVIATFAMSLGTAITVSALAALAVGSRELAMRLGGGAESVWGARIRATAGIGGAALVLGLGLVLMVGSLSGANTAAF